MRIIAGEAGGRRLVAPRSSRIRPTLGRVKEALFSILGDLRGAVVVDAFAGTGALGCEALSRGAQRCIFIDQDSEAIAIVRQNVAIVEAKDRAQVLQGRFEAMLAQVDADPDLWLIDPPYGRELAQRALEVMAEASCVTAGSLAVVEALRSSPGPKVKGFEEESRRRYGDIQLIFFRRGGEAGRGPTGVSDPGPQVQG